MFINWSLREIHLKLVYYGAPLSGKTTNLQQLHAHLPQNRRGELVSVKTREDRTLFFDFMQLELGEVKGLKPKFKLFTVPGQVYYAATRKLVLKDVDGLIFVADSSTKRLAANRLSIQDLNGQLTELGKSLDTLPFVLQCNKQDLPDAVPPQLLQKFLQLDHIPMHPAIALKGEGITETLRTLISQVVSKL